VAGVAPVRAVAVFTLGSMGWMASGRMGPEHYYYLALVRSHTLVISSSHIYIEIPEFDKLQLAYSELIETLHHGIQLTILLFATDRSTGSIKIRQSPSSKGFFRFCE
jgi:hypothetical protein